MANRLPTLPFLPSVPPQPGQAYAKALNSAIGAAYQDLARSVDGQILTGTGTTLPGASGLRRFYWNGSTLYFDSSTSWTPIVIGGPQFLSRVSTILPTGCYPHALTAAAGPGIMIPEMQPLEIRDRLTMGSMDLFFSSGQATAAGSSQAKRLTIHAALYSSVGAVSWSLLSSTSHSLAWTVTGATNGGTFVRRAIVPWALDISQGWYNLAVMTSSSSSGNGLAQTHSQIRAASPIAFTFVGDVGDSVTSISSHQMVFGFARRSASTSSWATAEQYSNWSHTAGNAFPLVALRAFQTV